MSLGKNIRTLRESIGLTQDQFVKKLNELAGLGLKRTTISNYEKDLSSPSAITLPFIAKILDVTIDELFVPPDVPSYVPSESNSGEISLVSEPVASYGNANELEQLKKEVERLKAENLAYLKAFEAMGRAGTAVESSKRNVA